MVGRASGTLARVEGPDCLHSIPMPVDRDLFRRISGSFPTGVTIITTRDADGAPKGLTTQSFIGLSTEPPLMLVSIDKTSRTLSALERSNHFVVNFLKHGAEDVATRFASKSEDKFSGVPWRPSAVAGGVPILHESSVAYAECAVDRRIEAGDHWIFIGRVEGGAVLAGIPLMYYRRTYAAWPEEKPAPAVG
jgi:flavin-dependent trigonelline monooxygenase, reductase component